MVQAVIELQGPRGVGKTTLATTMADELSHAALLFIDASPDGRLTEIMAPTPPRLGMASLLAQKGDNREAIDWAFHDLAVPVGEDMDLIVTGALPDHLEATERAKLRYGLTRFIETYDYVIVDGMHPLLHGLLPEEGLRSVLVLTPASFSGWQPADLASGLRTPYLILNRMREESLSPVLARLLERDELMLIGRLPDYATAEDRVRRLPDDFRNCLLRMNIPINLASGS